MNYDEALALLTRAAKNYQQKTQALAAIQQCDSYWPDDPPHGMTSDRRTADYPGTRCQLLAGHDQQQPGGPPPTQHRHRILGSQVVVTW